MQTRGHERHRGVSPGTVREAHRIGMVLKEIPWGRRAGEARRHEHRFAGEATRFRGRESCEAVARVPAEQQGGGWGRVLLGAGAWECLSAR